ncbi:MAG: helix-hairpin-helix domain-containing protein [Gammaproteobacteria bacterium]|nr:helix-hairpin-helix domain-containing protein [Gammaproteobacteria bacterium]
MKNPNRETVANLDELPNIGKAIAADLILIGIEHPQDLIGKNPLQLYATLCEKTGVRKDPCVIDVFMSVVDFMEGEEPHPWWFYTKKRKKLEKFFQK